MRCAVVTTIQPPTPAILALAARKDGQCVVVGDKKTPKDWNAPPAIYLPWNAPQTAYFALTPLLPYNHYCRKNLGYLFAMRSGADEIYETDDDNMPEPDISFPPMRGTYDAIEREDDWVNIYQFFASAPEPNIWPRGLPLSLITRKEDLSTSRRQVAVAVWQGLADNEPDVDAIYRLTCNKPYIFAKRRPIALGHGAWCPFNTQNTLFYEPAFELLYVPATVSFRFSDILRGIVCQAALHAHGMHLGFTGASVRQERNEHDYMHDFEQEIPMYEQADAAKSLAAKAVSQNADMGENLMRAYKALLHGGIVEEFELTLVNAWLKDCEDARLAARA